MRLTVIIKENEEDKENNSCTVTLKPVSKKEAKESTKSEKDVYLLLSNEIKKFLIKNGERKKIKNGK